MTLLRLESFDTGEEEIQATGTTGAGSGRSTTHPRTGTYGYLCGNANANDIYYDLGASEEDDTIIMGLAEYLESGATGTDIPVIDFREGATRHTGVYLNGTSRSVKVKRNTVLLAESDPNVWDFDSHFYLEAKITVNNTTGAYEVRINGVTILSATGVDTQNGGTAIINRVGSGSMAAGGHYIDDLYIANEQGTVNNDFLGDIAVEALLPNGNGNYSQLVGSDADSTDNYLQVDDDPDPSAADYNGSATVAQKDTYSFADLAATAGTVHAVLVSLSAFKSDAGAKSMRRVHRRATTDTPGPDHALATGLTSYFDMMETDPVAAGAWTIANVNASEWGAEVRT